MKTSTIIWIIVIIIVIFGGWYLITKSHSVPNPVPTSTAGLNGSPDQTDTVQSSSTPLVTIASDPTLGNYLVATNGMTLYTYSQDTANTSNCNDTCAQTWLPYTATSSEPLTPGDGVMGVLSSITRTDGTTQLTYNGMPLYFYKNDMKSGDTKGQNVAGMWAVATP